MNHVKRIALLTTTLLLLLLVAANCNDSNKQESPVRIVTNFTQTLHQIDLAPNAVGCGAGIGTVIISSVVVEPPTTNTNVSTADLNQVTIDRYQVSYKRIDGGHLVPAPFVRATDVTIASGGSSSGTTFIAFDPNALTQAPFAALLPQNGGVDPETGKPVITMDVTVTFFGQTLAGERVSGTTRFTLDFCYSCGCA